jgi:hypothetical protein
MALCPLCEHVQESGRECDVCGRGLAADPVGEAEPAARLEGLEPTQALPEEVYSSLLTDLEPTALAPSLPGADRPSAPRVACLYCARVGAPGEVFCPSCGVKLPLPRPTASPAGIPEPERRCRGCGMRVAGEVCPACGTRHREA